MQEKAKALLAEGTVKLIIGFEQGTNKVRPYFCSKPEDVDKLIYSEDCNTNNAVYLTKKEIIGDDKIPLFAYLNNILEHHFKVFEDMITKEFNEKYKGLF